MATIDPPGPPCITAAKSLVAFYSMRYPVLLFDLFRTVVTFTPQAPTGQVREPTWRSAMGALRERASVLLPEVPFDAVLDAIYEASLEIARQRPPEHFEVPIAERYRRGVARLGLDGPRAIDIAAELAAIQLATQAANTHLPPGHGEVLRELAGSRRLGLVSNFDHGPTAHAILSRHGLDRVFSAVVISIEFGRRKPHPAIFHEALSRLDGVPHDALFIGDSLGDDVAGAQSAGLDTAWLNWHRSPRPQTAAVPTYELAALVDLPALLADE